MRVLKALGAVLLILSLAPQANAQARNDDPVEKVRQHCSTTDRIASIYDCGCIVAAYKAAQAKHPGDEWQGVYNDVYRSEESRACARPELVWKRSILSCGTGYSLYKNLDRKNLGKAAFCHCVSDARRDAVATVPPAQIVSLPRGRNPAVVQCGRVDSYAVPADSPFRPVTPRPVPTLAKGLKLDASNRYIYLVVINKTFDVGKLDHLRYAISDGYDNSRPNDSYVTVKTSPVTELPKALIARGATPPGKIDPRNEVDAAQMALSYNQAILIRGSDLLKVRKAVAGLAGVRSVDYYVVSGPELYAVPDLEARLVR